MDDVQRTELLAALEAALGDTMCAAKRMAKVTSNPSSDTPELLSIYTELVATANELGRAIAAIRARGEV